MCCFKCTQGKKSLKGRFLTLCLGIFFDSRQEGAKHVNVMSWGQKQHDHLLPATPPCLPCYLTFYSSVNCLLKLKCHENCVFKGHTPEMLEGSRGLEKILENLPQKTNF